MISLIAILRIVLQSSPRAIGIQEEINLLFSDGDLRGSRRVCHLCGSMGS